ncbi:MAG: ABC transporter permease, partial [Sphingobacteriaceae bacterium]
VKGNPSTALKDPLSIVISQTTAKKYFGNEDPMGKVVTLDQDWQLKVTGVFKDIPSNTHLDFDMVIPITNYENTDWFKVWRNNNEFVYVRIDNPTDVAALEKQFPAFMQKYMGADMAKMGAKFDLFLRPLKDIYFEPASEFDAVRHGDRSVVYIFLSIAALILIIACINFMNLSTIRAVERSKEVGLRKVMGALRNHLIWQFIGESVLLTLISCILAIALLLLLMPWYSGLLGYTLTVSWNSMPIYLFLTGIILFVGFLAGSYPAFFLSAFSPIQALKGKLQLGKSGAFFRQALVVVQFCISVFLIVGTIVIYKQMSYVKSKDLGYDKQQSVVIPLNNNDIYTNMRAFKNDLMSKNNIESVSYMSGEPGGFYDIHVLEVEGQQDDFKPHTEFADFEYVKTLGVKIVAGRDFSPSMATDTTDAILINQTAAKKLGFTDQQAIGKWMKEDRRVAVIKLKPGNIATSIATIKEAYSRVAPAYPLEYTFLDQKFDKLYKNDLRQQTILSVFSGLAIFIACLGLFGLASFTAAKRTKEIGVRKVLGSSVQNILLLLSKDMLKPVAVATVIAMPFAYFSMEKWLQNFAYRTPLHWWVFVLAAVVTFAIALFTISFQSLKAAVANPVKSLRSE